jgi:hypothetical protein
MNLEVGVTEIEHSLLVASLDGAEDLAHHFSVALGIHNLPLPSLVRVEALAYQVMVIGVCFWARRADQDVGRAGPPSDHPGRLPLRPTTPLNGMEYPACLAG